MQLDIINAFRDAKQNCSLQQQNPRHRWVLTYPVYLQSSCQDVTSPFTCFWKQSGQVLNCCKRFNALNDTKKLPAYGRKLQFMAIHGLYNDRSRERLGEMKAGVQESMWRAPGHAGLLESAGIEVLPWSNLGR